MVEFFISFFDLLGQDLLRVVEEVRLNGRVLPNFNSTFLALIPKMDKLKSHGGLRPIYLCNYTYKIIAKVIAVYLINLLSKVISPEQFVFLKGRQIHEAIGVAQAELHNI